MAIKQQLEALLSLADYATTASVAASFAAESTARSTADHSEATTRSEAIVAESTARSAADHSEATVRTSEVASLAAAKQDLLYNGIGTYVVQEGEHHVSVQVDDNTIIVDSATNALKAIKAEADWSTVTNQPLINNHSLASGNNTLAALGIQATLVSGTNIKTINNTSVLGSGDIEVGTVASEAALASSAASAASAISSLNSAKADKASVYTKSETDDLLSYKQDELFAGVNIKNINDESILGSDTIRLATPADVASEASRAEASEAAIMSDFFALESEVDEQIDEISVELASKADKDSVYTKEEVDEKVDTKQDVLISGTNIKTINGEDILGSGDILVEFPDTQGEAAVWEITSSPDFPLLTLVIGDFTSDVDLSALTNLSDIARDLPEIGDFIIDKYRTVGVVTEIYGDPMAKVMTISIADYSDVKELFTVEV